MKILIFSALCFVTIFSQAQAYWSSLILKNPKTNTLIGSATHLCIGLQQDALYFLTAAHVVEGVDDIVGSVSADKQGRALKKVQVSSKMDLALLRADPSSFDVMIPCQSLPPVVFADLDVFQKAFDVLALATPPEKYLLEIEGYDSEKNAIRTETVEAPLIRSIQSGFPGREEAGNVLMTTFKARPGFSGGLVMSYIKSGGFYTADEVKKIEKETGDKSWFYLRKAVVGIVTASDPVHNRVALIPYNKLIQWLNPVFFRDANLPSGETSLVTSGGIYDKELGVFTYTPSDSLLSEGLSSYGGVGTGRPSVGVTKTDEKTNTGLILKDQTDKKWLSIGKKWVEGSPVDGPTRKYIRDSSGKVEGLYKNIKGEIKKTEEAPLPDILGLEEIVKALGESVQTCHELKIINLETREIRPIHACEENKNGTSQFILKTKDLRVEMKVVAGENQNVQIQATINTEKAVVHSLRRFSSSLFTVKIEGLSGFEIYDKQKQQTWIGPVK